MNNDGWPDHTCGACYCDEEPTDGYCRACGERMPQGEGVPVEGEGVMCRPCAHEFREAAREEVTVVA